MAHDHNGRNLGSSVQGGGLPANARVREDAFDNAVGELFRFGLPHSTFLQVFVNWTEIPGSKIRFTSILLMATELLILKASPCGLLSAVRGIEPDRTQLPSKATRLPACAGP